MRNIPAEMKEKARQALERAEAFIAEGTEASARHACLELRFAIEYVVFQHFHAYIQEVSDDAMTKWTPKQVIDQMREVDPFADQTAQISFGVETTPGVRPEKMQILGEDRRFPLKWANSSYNALGNFLHAPSLDQISRGQVASAEIMLAKARDIAKVVAETLDTTITNSNLGSFYHFSCVCGQEVKRRKHSFAKDDGVTCRACGAVYDVTDDPVGGVRAKLRGAAYTCDSCNTEREVPLHRMKVGNIISCSCGAKVRAGLGVFTISDDQAADAASSEENEIGQPVRII